MFDKTVFCIGNQVYLSVVEAVVSLSADGILCLFLPDRLSFSLHLALCRFSPVSVYMFSCNANM